MLITPEMIATAAAAGACRPALAWLRVTPRTIDELVRERPGCAVWAFQIPGFVGLLTDAEFDVCARYMPQAALRYACSRLADEQFAECVMRAPPLALQYAHRRLSDEQFAKCAMAAPDSALMFAQTRLSDAQFAACVESAPAHAWEFARYRLSPEQRDYCKLVCSSPMK